LNDDFGGFNAESPLYGKLIMQDPVHPSR